MPRSRDSDDDDEDSSRPSPLSQTQRFTKSGNAGSKDLKTTFSKSKYNEVPISKLNLNSVNGDSLSDSDDDTTSKTGRSTSSATPSQLTPKPRERSFLRGNTDKPKVQPRHFDDDDDRNVFGQTTMKPSPRHHISTLREDEERDQSFAHGFRDEKKRKSPTDMFAADSRSRPTVNSRKFHSDQSDSDDSLSPKKPGKSNTSQKSPRSPTDNTKPSSRKSSIRSKGESDRSDDEDIENSNRRFTRQDYTKKRSSNHDLVQVISIVQFLRFPFKHIILDIT